MYSRLEQAPIRLALLVHRATRIFQETINPPLSIYFHHSKTDHLRGQVEQRLMTRRVGVDLPEISYKIHRDPTIRGSFHEFHHKFFAVTSSSMAESVATPEFTNNDTKETDDKKKKKKLAKSGEGKTKSSSGKSPEVPVEKEEGAADPKEATNADKDAPLMEGKVAEKQTTGTENTRTSIKNDSKRESNANIEKSTTITLREIDFRSLAELKEAFHLFDVNRDGLIDKDDLKYTFTSLGRPEVTDEELETMLGEMSNTVDFDAFVKCFGYKAIELDPEATLLDALSNWDYEGNGMISEERIRRDLQKWGDRFTEREVDRALEEAPLYKKDGVVMIDYVKFCAKLCGLRNVATCRRIEKEGEAFEADITT